MEKYRPPAVASFRSRMLYAVLALAGLSMPAHAVNSLSIADPDAHGTVPGFIDSAVAEIAMEGSVANIDLTLIYSDHGAAEAAQTEIRHMFELPQGAFVKGMWLWINGAPVAAGITDNWSAQKKYDQITQQRRDPALLQVKAGQYDLHVYPLVHSYPGQYANRKVKISVVVPVDWSGTGPAIALPLAMLKAPNQPSLPLQVSYRNHGATSPMPAFAEAPGQILLPQARGDGNSYATQFRDINGFASLNLRVDSGDSSTAFRAWYSRDSSGNYIQLGVRPQALFGIGPGSRATRKISIGLDLSGAIGGDPAVIEPQVEALVGVMTAPGDSVRLTWAGEGKMETFDSRRWLPAGADSLRAAFAKMNQGALFAAKAARKKPVIVFADSMAYVCWGYPGLGDIATIIVHRDIMSSLADFPNADIVAAYYYGFHEAIDSAQSDTVLAALQPFFQRGGEFLTYIDFNREGERLATHYIRGLSVPGPGFAPMNLVRNETGTLGRAFPPTFYHHTACLLANSDTAVTAEVLGSNGVPVVVSKPVGPGRIVVSGIWSFLDGSGEKQLTASPLLGLHALSKQRQIGTLLRELADQQKASAATHQLILSNSSGYPDAPGISTDETGFLQSVVSNSVLTAVNLAEDRDYQPAQIVSSLVKYYGDGFVLSQLAAATGGTYFDVTTTPWTGILAQSTVSLYPSPVQFSVDITNESGAIVRALEAFPTARGGDQPRFFSTAIGPSPTMTAVVSAWYPGDAVARVKTITIAPEADADSAGIQMDSKLAYGAMKLKNAVAQHADTLTQMDQAFAFRILTDYTAFIAVEPTDGIPNYNYPYQQNGSTEIRPQADPRIASLDWKFRSAGGVVAVEILLPGAGSIELEFLDCLGRQLKVLRSQRGNAGSLNLVWNTAASPAIHGKILCVMKYRRQGKSIPPEVKTGWLIL